MDLEFGNRWSVAPQFLIMAREGREAGAIIGQLAKAGLTSATATGDQLLAAIASNRLCSAILTIEAFCSLDGRALQQALGAQAPWSDFPLIVITRRNDRPGACSAYDSQCNVIALERPMHPRALEGAARQALRARARQAEAAAILRQHDAAEAQVRALAESLETRVITRSAQLIDALAERVAIAKQLRASEEEYRLTFELSSQIPWSASADGIMVDIAQRWRCTFGEPNARAGLQSWMAFVHPEDIDQIACEWQRSTTHKLAYDVEFRMGMKNTSYRWHHARAAPLFGRDHRIIKWYGTIEDIDDSRGTEARFQMLQSELAHMSRLSAMGAMASTLAHELNQPLTATTNFLRGVRRLLEQAPGEQRKDLIDAVSSADRNATRAGDIIRRLREMVSRGGVARRPEQLGSLIRDACALGLLDAASQGIAYVIEIADEDALIDVDRIQIQQVLHNLLRNAVEALAHTHPGEITITAQPQGAFYEIVVSDNGPGIAAEAGERLFDAFNSSKPDGMGIGLSISRTIIEAHGGSISCDRGNAGGAVFRFTVPAIKLAA